MANASPRQTLLQFHDDPILPVWQEAKDKKMITGSLKSKIDKLWEEFWTGGIANPLTVIEQISFLMFCRLLDMRESTAEKKWLRSSKNKGKKFPGEIFNPKRFPKDFFGKSGITPADLRWSSFRHLGGEELLPLIRDHVFAHLRLLGQAQSEDDNTFGQYMKDANFMINKPSLLSSAVTMINDLPLNRGDTKGDLYEYLLSKLTTAGINGQFRTPRHIIRLMADMLLEGNHDEALTWTVGDPACGTGGFPIGFLESLIEHFTSDDGRIEEEVEVVDDKGKPTGETKTEVTFTGDKLSPEAWKHISEKMFVGFDFDVTMLRIAAMNLMLHGVDKPSIYYQDTLSSGFSEKYPKMASESLDVVLANPPFKGSLDYDDVDSSLIGKVKTKKTELLFLVLILRLLKLGGRCAVVVPDGVSFGSSKAHKELRKMLVEENQLEAVVNLPSGVFKPYAGVSTAILIFTKGGQTDDVVFFNIEKDGFSLDDKRDPRPQEDDLPIVREQWAKWLERKSKRGFTDRKKPCFCVPKKEIAENGYDLSLNRYKETVYEEIEYDPPKILIGRLRELEKEIAKDLDELEAMLG